ncbi:putative biotin carboxylase [Paraburkholderia ribeironis]|uniref:Putative biotin carboxylase n=1 Tax=Paraburkholderia ribeironis TaxID=1247936 RepID=A0A1N7S891_9BURK|nr:biotin carboxylase [Paraburkholderia ribeironis]SIT43573.1 putative biotin carboxylase [Paraburkholderia ribeironis]
MTVNHPSQGSRIVVLNRWSDGLATYHRYIDHAVHNVAYVCTPNGAAALRASRIAHVEQLSDILDEDALHEAVLACHEALGGIDRLIALSEFDLITAARLRNSFNIPGELPDTVVRFRDKAVMKYAVAAAGLRVPRFAALEDLAFPKPGAIDVMRFPIIVKPRNGAASIGVRRVDTRAQFDVLWPTLPLVEYECEEYIDGPVYHVDGFMLNGAFLIARASRYVNTCLQFEQGKPLGSVMLDLGPLNDALLAFAEASLRALALSNGPFHLEIIGGGDGLYFLEVGTRVGRGEIPFLFHDLYGVDLFDLWVAQQSGDEARFAAQAQAAIAASASPARGGFLMLPEPVGKVFVDAQLPQGIPALYGAVFPTRHHFFDGAGGYETTILARFRYRGASEDEIATAIHATLRDFRYTLAEIVTPALPG